MRKEAEAKIGMKRKAGDGNECGSCKLGHLQSSVKAQPKKLLRKVY